MIAVCRFVAMVVVAAIGVSLAGYLAFQRYIVSGPTAGGGQ